MSNNLCVSVVIGDDFWFSRKMFVEYQPDVLKKLTVKNLIQDVKPYCLHRLSKHRDKAIASIADLPKVIEFKWASLDLKWSTIEDPWRCSKWTKLDDTKITENTTMEAVLTKYFEIDGPTDDARKKA